MDQSSSEDLEINCQRICSAAGDVICPEHFGCPRILLHTLSVGGTSLLFVNAHFAAHQHKVKERNADFARIDARLLPQLEPERQLQFRVAWLDDSGNKTQNLCSCCWRSWCSSCRARPTEA